MKATLGLELIGGDEPLDISIPRQILNEACEGVGDITIGEREAPLWVAEIIGRDQVYRYGRRFLRGTRNYKYANAAGTRGIFTWYILESGRVYEVKSPQTWSRTDRYFCRVTDDGDIVRITKEEVDEWIERCSASMS